MKDYIECKKCENYYWTDKGCRCQPFEVYYPEWYGEEKEKVYGFSFEDVVQKIAERINSDEPEFDCDIFEYPIEVTDINGVTKMFNCYAQISVDYYAREQDKEIKS